MKRVLTALFITIAILSGIGSVSASSKMNVVSKIVNGFKKYGFAGSDGKLKIDYIYDYAEDFSENVALVNRNGRSFFINEIGAEAFASKTSIFKYISGFRDGLALVELDGKYGYINKLGRLSVPAIYEDAFEFREGVAAVCKDGKYGYINTDGKVIIDFKYDLATPFSNGRAKVCINGKYGFISIDGEKLTPMIYEKAGTFSDGLCPVRINSRYSYINRFGFFLTPLMYDWAQDFESGLAMVCINDKFGYIDTEGKEVIQAKYKTLNRFEDGYLICSLPYGISEAYGIVDKNETILVPFLYEEITYIGNKLFIAEVDGHFGLISLKQSKYKVVIKANYDYMYAEDGVIHAFLNGKELTFNAEDL